MLMNSLVVATLAVLSNTRTEPVFCTTYQRAELPGSCSMAMGCVKFGRLGNTRCTASDTAARRIAREAGGVRRARIETRAAGRAASVVALADGGGRRLVGRRRRVEGAHRVAVGGAGREAGVGVGGGGDGGDGGRTAIAEDAITGDAGAGVGRSGPADDDLRRRIAPSAVRPCGTRRRAWCRPAAVEAADVGSAPPPPLLHPASSRISGLRGQAGSELRGSAHAERPPLLPRASRARRVVSSSAQSSDPCLAVRVPRQQFNHLAVDPVAVAQRFDEAAVPAVRRGDDVAAAEHAPVAPGPRRR